MKITSIITASIVAQSILIACAPVLLARQDGLANQFRTQAPAGWQAYRNRIRDEIALEIQLSVTDSLRHPDNDERTHRIRDVRFSDRRLTYSSSILLEASWEVGEEDKNLSRIVAQNPRYAFALQETRNSSWRTNLVEVQPRKVAALDGLFGQDPRLKVGRHQSIEDFYESNQSSFSDFRERSDPKLGKMVVARFHSRTTHRDLSAARRRAIEKRGLPTDLVTETTGTFEFLVDHYWIPRSYHLEKVVVDGKGNELRRGIESLRSTYTATHSKPFIPATVTTLVAWTPADRKLEEVHEYRELTDQEIADIREACYLTNYGMPEPEGSKPDLPGWIWMTSCGAGLVVIGALVRTRFGST